MKLALVVVGLLVIRAGAQESWTRFRGPNGQGVATEVGPLPVGFGPQKGLLWKCPVSLGHSSPCVFGDRIFLTGALEEDRLLEVLCIGREKGNVLWRRSVEVPRLERVHRINSPATPTPVTDGERVFVSFGSFGLLCFDFEGNEVWRRELPPRKNFFGTGASPIVVGGRLVFCRDTNEESYLEVIEPKTGKTIWKKDRSGFQSSWSTPSVRRAGDVEELLVYGAFRLTAYDLADGAERWSVPGLADEPCITPAVGEGLVFVSSYNMRTNPEVIGLPEWKKLLLDYDTDENGLLTREEVKPNKSILSRHDADGEGDHPLGGFFRFLDEDRSGDLTEIEWQKMSRWLGSFKHKNAVLAIRPGDGKDQQAEIVWQHSRCVPEVPSLLHHEGLVYFVKNGGLFTCLDAATGKQHYQERTGARGPYYASPIVGDGKIYTASARGVVTVIEAGSKFRVLATNDLGARIMATPALLPGRIYIRTETHLLAFGMIG